MNIGDKVSHYIGLRAELDEARKVFKVVEKRVKSEMQELEVEILIVAQDMGVKAFPTEMGTAYIATKTYASVEDREAMIKYATDSGDFGLFTNHVNKNHLAELIDDRIEPLSLGVNYSVEKTINIRKG